MKTDKFRKIESFKDIEIEKERLQFQISLSEERINDHFNSLAGKFTFEHLSAKIADSFLGSAYEFLKFFRWGYKIFSNKNREEHDEE